MIDASTKYHDFMEGCNFIKTPSEQIADFFDTHPTTYKIVLLINHLFRAAMMVGMMYIPYIPFGASVAVCVIGSLFYRLTVERNCAYKFALPALAGAASFMIALPAIISIINKTAFTSTTSGLKVCASFIPFILYGIDTILTVNYNVNKTLEEKANSCCKKKQ